MLRYNRDSGFILISILILLLILAGVSLYSLATIRLLIKSSRHHWEWRIAQATALTRLRLLEKQLLSGEPVCIIPVMSSAQLASRPMIWWQAHLCVAENQLQPYYYGVEYLGSDPCAMVTNNGHDLIAEQAAYYRITLLMPRLFGQKAKIILQSTVAKPISITTSCDGKIHHVANGEQMFRVLT